jgi:hypothetical protein
VSAATILEVVPYTGEDVDMQKTPRVRVVLDMSAEDANTLAAAKIAQGESSLYAADAKPPANVLADALVAAGHGMGE